MSRLHDLLRQLDATDPALAKDLRQEVEALTDRRAFGLNFERHVPESVELPGRKVRRGDKVHILPERGKNPGAENSVLWRVESIDRAAGTAILEPLVEVRGAPAPSLETLEAEPTEAALDDLVVVAEFRDPIYPGLVSTGKVERGGDKPFHSVITAENFHALQALLFTHRGRIDCIYIDPPYNTGARDWKYNNNYVESDDLYRHSKWLAFMERRLILARELLNPSSSALLITIDEKECHRLGLLLQQIFPDATIQMVTSVINPKGTPKRDYFARVEEYIFIVYVGEMVPVKTSSRMLSGEESEQAKPVRWASLQRSGGQSLREETQVKFFPIFLDSETGRIVDVGDHVGPDFDINQVTAPAGVQVQWPIKSDGRHGCWQVSDATLRIYLEQGRVQVGSRNRKTGRWTLNFLMSSDWQRIQDGSISVLGRDANGALVLSEGVKTQHGKTVWTMTSHSGADHGTAMVKALLPDRKFPYPKSVYAVEDALRFFVGDRKEAIVLDFFAGSGTTVHAVMRLNKQDGGRRTCIAVTNNEVSGDSQQSLRASGNRPGDPDWESLGICDYITKPRVAAAITGLTPEGQPVVGSYRFTDEFPISAGLRENAEFFSLTHENQFMIAAGRVFERIAPLLWLRAGAVGRRIDSLDAGWDVADAYGVIADLDRSKPFLRAVAEGGETVRLAFVVTDEDRLFQTICRELPDHVEPVRLYEAYLRNFEIESGRSSR